jgi:hypothetical protein
MSIKDEYFPFPEGELYHSNHQQRKNVLKQLQNDLKAQKINALEKRSFVGFMIDLMEPHNTIHHVLFCSMWQTSTAAYEPIFFLHHSFVDKIFSDWQAMPKRQVSPLEETILRPFDRNYDNPFSLTRKTTRQAWYYKKNLCYRYDGLGKGRSSKDPYIDPYIVTDDCKKRSLFWEVNGTDFNEEDKEKGCSDKPKRIYKFKTYVGLVLPIHLGSGMLEYSIDGSNNYLGINVIARRNVAIFGGNPTETK